MQREDFEHVTEIVGGAYGKLFKARHKILGRDVVLKIVDTSADGIPDALAHAWAMAKVEHENIVKIFSIENFDLLETGSNQDVIVMQWPEGSTIKDLLAARDFLPTRNFKM